MKKISLLIAGFAIVSGAFAQSSSTCATCETAPNIVKTKQNQGNKALWTVQMDVDPTNIGTGLAGAAWTGTEFWVSEWGYQSNTTFYTLNASGVSTGSFNVTGISGSGGGARSITTDGTDMYVGNGSTNIYRINKTTKAITATIGTAVTVRYCTYDPTLDGGNGGFWVGDFNTAWTAVNMSGATLSSIAAGTHGQSGVYGLALDPYSTGGDYLWAFTQPGNPGAVIVQVNKATGAPTGLTHDANTDVGGGSGLGGGLFICNNYISGKNSMIGINQGESIFAYELADPLPNDIQMDAVTNGAYAAAGNQSITGTIRNVGLNTVTSVDISWDNGSGPNNQTFSVNIPANGTYNFTHGTQMNVVAGTNYNVCVSVTLSGDPNQQNDTVCTNITGLTTIPAKKVVGEEKTGTWCGWCPRGAVGLANMEAQNDFIGIAVHNNDAMMVSSYDGAIGTYVPGGYPGGGVDRVLDGDPSASSFLAMHNARKTAIVPCEVKNIFATLNTTTNQISVSADAEWYGNIPGNFRMSCVITEDNVISSNQSNYYGAGQNGGPGGIYDNNGPMAFPTGINNAFDFYGASSSVASSAFLGYDHTARSLSNNDILGDAGSLPASITTGTHSHTFADVSGTILDNVANAHAVVMIIDASTGEILNADVNSITTITSVEEIDEVKYELNVFPNPTRDMANITFNLEENSAVTIEVYNAMGALVNTQNPGVLNAGEHKFTFDGTDLTSGFYFVNLTVGNKVISKKVSLLK
jgi:hypothetical protein